MILIKGKRYWYNANWCYIIYRGEENGKYKFEDFGDRIYYLTENEIEFWVREEKEIKND